MLTITKTIELLGKSVTPEQAEDIRSFTYELAELFFDSGSNYQKSLINNYEQHKDDTEVRGDGLGNGGDVNVGGTGVEENNTAPIPHPTT